MINYFKDFSNSLLSLNRYAKRAIALLTDISLGVLCTWIAFCLRLDELILLNSFNLYAALIAILIATPIFWLFGLYRTIFRYTSFSIIFTLMISTFVYGLIFRPRLLIFPEKPHYSLSLPFSGETR